MVPMSKLAELVDAMKPTIVVAPDFMNRPVETRYVAQAFEAICHPSAAIMYVCHAIKPHGPMADYLDEVRYAADNYNVIGIPRCLPSRGAWLPAIADAAGDKPIHFLGLRMDEIDDLNSSFIEHVTSIDSAKFSDGRANGN